MTHPQNNDVEFGKGISLGRNAVTLRVVPAGDVTAGVFANPDLEAQSLHAMIFALFSREATRK